MYFGLVVNNRWSECCLAVKSKERSPDGFNLGLMYSTTVRRKVEIRTRKILDSLDSVAYI